MKFLNAMLITILCTTASTTWAAREAGSVTDPIAKAPAEAAQETTAASKDVIGCTKCVKDMMDRMATHMPAEHAANVARDLTAGKSVPSLGSSTTSE